MSYVPHTDAERATMLERIGAPSIEALFGDVPAAYRFPKIDLPAPISEMEVMRELRRIAAGNIDVSSTPSFLGGGVYRHYIPSVVDFVISRSEFYSAYTPYQAEISQGTLQTLFEYQTMICDLTGMEVSNASHYDGATAVAEAIIMSHHVGRERRRKVILSPMLHPEYRATARTYTQGMDLALTGDEDTGSSLADLIDMADDNTSCVVVQNPDFCGRIADLSSAAERLHSKGVLMVMACDPISLGLLKPPGAMGADIVVGEGQPLGNALNFGGPYLGFLACRKADVRRMSGRLVGQTVDADGQRGFVLTLSTREQHIRRERATSNICTNQGLLVLAASVYLASMGKAGLGEVAHICYQRAHYAAARIDALSAYSVQLDVPFFKEFVIECPRPVSEINGELYRQHGIIGGLDLSSHIGGSPNRMLLCVTEMNPRDEIDALVKALEEVAA